MYQRFGKHSHAAYHVLDRTGTLALADLVNDACFSEAYFQIVSKENKRKTDKRTLKLIELETEIEAMRIRVAQAYSNQLSHNAGDEYGLNVSEMGTKNPTSTFGTIQSSLTLPSFSLLFW